ncbi:MAG: hypothetical protein ACTHPD_11105 [Rhizomicrobium sp.]
MTEGPPAPITRGIELFQANIEKIIAAALERYKSLTLATREIDNEIDALLSRPASNAEARIEKAFQKRRALAHAADELENILLEAFSLHAKLEGDWHSLKDRLDAISEKITPQ